MAPAYLEQLDDKLPSLEEQGVERLVHQGIDYGDKDGKHVDRAIELKRLAKSLLLNFLELVGIMSTTPEAVRLTYPCRRTRQPIRN